MREENDRRRHEYLVLDLFVQNLQRNDDGEYGSIGVDCKRPFGNSDVENDILVAIGATPDGDDGDPREWSDQQREYAASLYDGIPGCLRGLFKYAVPVDVKNHLKDFLIESSKVFTFWANWFGESWDGFLDSGREEFAEDYLRKLVLLTVGVDSFPHECYLDGLARVEAKRYFIHLDSNSEATDFALIAWEKIRGRRVRLVPDEGQEDFVQLNSLKNLKTLFDKTNDNFGEILRVLDDNSISRRDVALMKLTLDRELQRQENEQDGKL